MRTNKKTIGLLTVTLLISLISVISTMANCTMTVYWVIRKRRAVWQDQRGFLPVSVTHRPAHAGKAGASVRLWGPGATPAPQRPGRESQPRARLGSLRPCAQARLLNAGPHQARLARAFEFSRGDPKRLLLYGFKWSLGQKKGQSSFNNKSPCKNSENDAQPHQEAFCVILTA